MTKKRHDDDDSNEVKGRRTLDRLIKETQGCAEHCDEHPINMYRISLLEEAKDALCIATKELSQQTGKTSMAMKVTGTILSVSAVFIMAATGLGWVRLAEFTEKIYILREEDRSVFELYKLETQKHHLELREDISLLEQRVKKLEK